MTLRARDVMQEKVRSVRPDTTLADLDRAFSREKRSGLPVVDEGGRLVGVVSRADIVRKLATEQSQVEYESDSHRDVRAYGEVTDEPIVSLAARVGARLANARAEDLMSHAPVTVAPDAPIQQVAKVLVDHAIHRVPVVEEQRLVGIVTTTDLVRLLAEGRIEAAD